jgi:hypothetical protein
LSSYITKGFATKDIDIYRTLHRIFAYALEKLLNRGITYLSRNVDQKDYDRIRQEIEESSEDIVQKIESIGI